MPKINPDSKIIRLGIFLLVKFLNNDKNPVKLDDSELLMFGLDYVSNDRELDADIRKGFRFILIYDKSSRIAKIRQGEDGGYDELLEQVNIQRHLAELDSLTVLQVESIKAEIEAGKKTERK